MQFQPGVVVWTFKSHHLGDPRRQRTVSSRKFCSEHRDFRRGEGRLSSTDILSINHFLSWAEVLVDWTIIIFFWGIYPVCTWEQCMWAEAHKRQRSQAERTHLALLPHPPRLVSYLIWEPPEWCCSFSDKSFSWKTIPFCFTKDWSLSSELLIPCSSENCVFSGLLHTVIQIQTVSKDP